MESMGFIFVNFIFFGVARALPVVEVTTDVTDNAREFLQSYDPVIQDMFNQKSHAVWNYYTNMTEENARKAGEINLDTHKLRQSWAKRAFILFHDKLQKITDDKVLKKLLILMILGPSNLSEKEQIRFNTLQNDMHKTINYAKYCENNSTCRQYPEIAKFLSNSRDYDELTKYWKGWFDASGRPMKNNFIEWTKLRNSSDHGDGYNNTAEAWISSYAYEETGDFERDSERLWLEAKPLYLQLHTYVRRKLYEYYGPEKINLRGPVPAQLFGDIFAQQWTQIYPLVMPYKDKQQLDFTKRMKEKNLTVENIFEMADEFFVSLGMLPATREFWDNSMLKKPAGRRADCQPSAWNFYNDNDFRIKMCANVTQEDFVTIHHEMGHIQYFMQYKHLPLIFRNGANPGFHEALGDTIALSVRSPSHLHQLGFIDEDNLDRETEINFLLQEALRLVSFLPYGYIVDKWRWSVFRGETTPDEYQKYWDELRLNYQGVVPPVKRDPLKDFDPGGKFHIALGVPYIRYFISTILTYQFYEGVCNTSGHTGLLYACDFHKSLQAGEQLSRALRLGCMEHWTVPMRYITGQESMTASSMLRYFQPLMTWLQEENERNGDVIGWPDDEWTPYS